MPSPAQTNPLDQLRDIHLPDPVGIWPPAPGWWVVAALLLIMICIASLLAYQRYRRNAYRRAAIHRLAEIDALRIHGEHQQYLQQLNQLLKQTALAVNERTSISSLTGKDWLLFLNNSADTQAFTDGAGSILEDGPYRNHIETGDLKALHQLAEQWIREHHARI